MYILLEIVKDIVFCLGQFYFELISYKHIILYFRALDLLSLLLYQLVAHHMMW